MPSESRCCTGPQGRPCGKNTTGGAINVTSKKPSLTPRDTDDYVNKIAGSGVGTVLAPWLAGRVSFHLEDRDGRLHNLFTGRPNAIGDDVLRGQLLAKRSDALPRAHSRKYETDGA